MIIAKSMVPSDMQEVQKLAEDLVDINQINLRMSERIEE